MVDDIEPALKGRRISAHTMGLRRRRIFARLREGQSYDEIAEEEGLSVTRIRQIVSEVLKKRSVDSGSELAKLQLERLGPVMQLASDAIAAGDVAAITPFLKVLDKFDRYMAIAGTNQAYDDGARKKLLDKINRVAANLGVDEEFEEVRREIQARKEAAAAAAATVLEPPRQDAAAAPPGEERKWFESGASS
jgi:DNA-binding CsgD family transcriptional regulator